MSTYTTPQRDFTTTPEPGSAECLRWRYGDLAECLASQLALLAALPGNEAFDFRREQPTAVKNG